MDRKRLRGAPLSLQQGRLWEFMQDNQVYRVQGSIVIKGNLDNQAFQLALQSLVKRQEILQTVFYCLPGMDTPLQIIGQPQQVYCPIISLEACSTSEQDNLLDDYFSVLQMQSFDLKRGPLLQTTLICLSNDIHVLLVAISALCADAPTLSLLVMQLAKIYENFFQVGNDEDEALQYVAVSAWQNKLLASESAKIPQQFWNKINIYQYERTYLPFEILEAVAPKSDSLFVPRLVSLSLKDDLCLKIYELAEKSDTTIISVLLTFWYIALFRLTGEVDQLVGIAGDGRTSEEIANILGPCTRFVPVNVYIDKYATFLQLLNTVHLSLQEAVKWQLYFAWPAPDNAEQNRLRSKYYPVLFEYENWPASVFGGELTFELSHRFCCTEPFCLKMSALKIGAHLQLDFFYDPRYISSGYISQFSSIIPTLLYNIVVQPETMISSFYLNSAYEQKRLIESFKSNRQYGIVYGLTELFETQVVRTPNLLAVVGRTEELTYQEVNKRANRLARVLRRHGIGPNVFVGLCLARSAQMVVAILAILKAGGAYLPLDSESPSARIEYQLQDAQVAMLFTQQNMLHILPAWDGKILCIDVLEEEIIQESDTNLPSFYQPGDLAYIIYTSGSTGLPKGVLIQQQSVVNYAHALCNLLGCEPGWQFATVSTIAADLGNTAIFCPLISGGCVQVLDYEIVTSGTAFARWAADHPIDVLKIVPSHLAALLADDELMCNILPHRALIMGGEPLPVKLISRLQKHAGNCRLYNHYGPTETTIGTLVNALEMLHEREQREEVFESQGGVLLGSPIANMEVYVLDELLQIVPVGVTGELYVGGIGVALGYLGEPEQTAARFVPHPFSEEPGRRLYRTGDLVKYTLQNQIAFVARRDNQVKLYGYRIELGEIEAVLERHPQVRTACALLREGGPSGVYLVAYIVVKQQPAPSCVAVQDFLRQYLPSYMIPPIIVCVKMLPLTANGKVNRHQLLSDPAGDYERGLYTNISYETVKKVILPHDMIEFQLLQIWKEILRIPSISVTDNFFDLGGHSILAVRLMADILKQFGQDVPLSAIFLHPTITSLASILRQQDDMKNQSSLAVLQAQGSNPPLFCVHPSGGIASTFLHLAHHLAPNQPFYGLQTTGATMLEDEISSIEDLAAYYIRVMQAVQPQGPYFIGGWSMGGIIALEMAQQLLQRGHEIGLLAIIDSRLASERLRTNAMKMTSHLSDEEFARLMVLHLKIELPADFSQIKREDQINYVFELAKKINGIPQDIGLEQVRSMFAVLKKHTRLAHIYTPRHYPHTINYFVSSDSFRSSQEAEDSESTARTPDRPDTLSLWREVALGGLTVHTIPGDHHKMLEEPNVQVLAASLIQCICSACSK